MLCFTVTRMEEKDSETKKEYSKLHERYTELFKTHIDYMERTKSILGTERLEQLQQQGGLGAARPRIAGMALNQLTRFVYFHSNISFHCTLSSVMQDIIGNQGYDYVCMIS